MARYNSVLDIPSGSSVGYLAYGLLFDGIENSYWQPYSSMSAEKGFWFDLEDVSTFAWPTFDNPMD